MDKDCRAIKYFLQEEVKEIFKYSNRVDIYDAASNTWSVSDLSNRTLTGTVGISASAVGNKIYFTREASEKAEGVMVDLHVVRVAQRLGIATSADPKKIEQQIMEVIPPEDWGEVGMAISFLGRETCRPSHPEHEECVMSSVCEYYREQTKSGK